MQTPKASIERRGDAIRLSGVLAANTVAHLRLDQMDLSGVANIVLDDVERVDTVGVALVAQLVSTAAAAGSRPGVSGRPAGLEELCRAYRISPDFSDFP